MKIVSRTVFERNYDLFDQLRIISLIEHKKLPSKSCTPNYLDLDFNLLRYNTQKNIIIFALSQYCSNETGDRIPEYHFLIRLFKNTKIVEVLLY